VGTERVSATEARAAAERAARTSYGRLVAILAASSGDLMLAEDALSDALERALRTWPDHGVPANPDGWLLTVARNRQRDVWKSAAHRTRAPLPPDPGDTAALTSPLDAIDPDAIGERRLELLFVCAHPAIDPAARTPLMLQVVLGLDAARIAQAYGVGAATMSKRLVRAKRRIADTRIPFTVPGRADMAQRLPGVLEAVYGSYAVTLTRGDEAPPRSPSSLAGEAHYLATTLATLLPTEPEVLGLAALISLSLARSPARRTDFVPLAAQNPAVWDAGLIATGEAYLRRASAADRLGRFQLEAAIQAVHCDRRRTGSTDREALRTLYSALVALAPTLGARVALAATVGQLDGPEAGLDMLPDGADAFQPAWATRAHLLRAAGRNEDAAAAFDKAASLTVDPAARRHLDDLAAALREPP
jgi:RNA polymerase sigma-70 factor (ECF subfamily)